MPILFKIIVLLFFKLGFHSNTSFQYETSATRSFQVVSMLVLEGDQFSIEQTVNNCLIVFPTLDIIREPGNESGIFIARLYFKELSFTGKQQLDQQLRQFKGRINIYWI